MSNGPPNGANGTHAGVAGPSPSPADPEPMGVPGEQHLSSPAPSPRAPAPVPAPLEVLLDEIAQPGQPSPTRPTTGKGRVRSVSNPLLTAISPAAPIAPALP